MLETTSTGIRIPSDSKNQPQVRQAFFDVNNSILITPTTPEVDSSNISIPLITSDDVFIRGTNIDTTVGNLSVIAFANPAADQVQIGGINVGPTGTAGGHFFIATRAAGSATLAERVRVTDVGFGIGTIAPQVQLEMDGTVVNRTYFSDTTNIAHGMTTLHPTSVFGAFIAGNATAGGFLIRGISDDGGFTALKLDGMIGSTTPTVTAILLRGFKKSGTTFAALADAEILLQVSNSTTTPTVTILGSGNLGLGTVAPQVQVELQSSVTNRFYLSDTANSAHGMTTLHPTNVFGVISNANLLTGGGLLLRGLNTGGVQAGIKLDGMLASATPTATVPAILFRGFKKGAGTTFATMADAETVLQVSNSTGTPNFTIMGSGNLGVGTVAPAARLHAIATTEQLRLGYDASNYAAFTISSAGTLTIAPIASINLAPAANVGIGTSTFGTSAVRNFSIANGTAPTTTVGSGLVQSDIWAKGITSLVSGGTGTTTNSLGSQLFVQAKGVTFRCHIAVGTWYVPVEVDQDIAGSYGEETINSRAHFTNFAGVDAATGFVPGKFQNISAVTTFISTTALATTSEGYGNRSLFLNQGSGATVTHLGKFYAATGEFLNDSTVNERINLAHGVMGMYNHSGDGNAGSVAGIQGRIDSSIGSTGTVDVANAGEFASTLAGGTRITTLRGSLASLFITATTSTTPIVGNNYGHRTDSPSIAGGSSAPVVTYNAGFDCFDQVNSNIVTSWNYRSRGATSINSFEGLTSFGSTSLPVSKVSILVTPTATANFGTLCLGIGPWDGATAGFFTGSASGTHIAINAGAGGADLAHFQIAGVTSFKVTAGGNVGIGNVTAFGTSAAGVLGIKNSVEPSTSPADMVQLYSVDLSAGNATLGLRTETAVVTEAVVSDRTLSIKVNGVVYKLLLKV